jgi:signal peptidase II
LAIAGTAADQASKFLVFHLLRDAPDGRVAIIPRILSLTCRYNTGTAFGLLQERNWLFILLTLFALAAVGYYLRRFTKPEEHLATAGAGMVAAGALGNLIDRIAFSGVRDFIDFHIWPVFNVADVLICAGAAALALSSLKKPEKENEEA